MWENGRLLFASEESGPDFSSAYLYLQMSSHSNYRAREVFFDEVRIRTPAPGK